MEQETGSYPPLEEQDQNSEITYKERIAHIAVEDPAIQGQQVNGGIPTVEPFVNHSDTSIQKPVWNELLVGEPMNDSLLSQVSHSSEYISELQEQVVIKSP